MWYRDWDDQPFETEEAAREAAREEMTLEDYQYGDLPFDKVLEWCFKQEGFFEAFSEELALCENYYFREHFIEGDDEE